MQEQQVDIVGLQALKRLHHRLFRVLVGFEVDLGNEEQFPSVDAAPPDAFPHFLFIAIGLRRVDHTVTALTGFCDGVGTGLTAEHKGSKTCKGHLHAVIQSQLFHVPSSVIGFAQTGFLCYNHSIKFV